LDRRKPSEMSIFIYCHLFILVEYSINSSFFQTSRTVYPVFE